VAAPAPIEVAFGWRQVAAPVAVIVGVAATAISLAATARPPAVVPPAVSVRAEPPAPPAPLPEPADPRPARADLIPPAWAVILTPLAVSPARPPAKPPRTAAQVVEELAQVPEVGLNTMGLTIQHFKDRPRRQQTHPILVQFDHHDELRGLPVLRGGACQLSSDAARNLDTNSQRLRAAARDIGLAVAANTVPSRQEALLPYRTRLEEAGYPESHAPLLLQMFQCEGEPQRELLTDLLGRAQAPAAGRALAQRALFEADPDLRRQASQALRSRPAEEVRRALLDGIRHPWPAAADHAADALAALGDRGAVPELLQLLDAPNPAAPFRGDDGTLLVREVVRVNHLHNCLLCHAPSWSRSDVARSVVPSPDQPLSQSPGSPSAYGSPSAADQMFVRVDVTYLRQDFSLMLDVANPGLWPKKQRYDFFVRTRPLRAEDWAWATQARAHPQREAVLRALRQITGQDFGDRAEDWRDGLRNDARFRL
jgi:hypothetical protein